MLRPNRLVYLLVAALLVVAMTATACAPAPAPTPAPQPTAKPAGQPTAAPQATAVPPTAAPKPTEDPLKGLSEAQKKWLQAAELGPFAKEQDWKAIEEAAKKEGKVVVYSASSRIPDVAKSFEAAYPGIKVEGYDLGTVDTINKVREEAKAGAHVGDVFFAGDPATVLNDLLPKHLLWNFVPSDLASVIPKELQEPLLVQRLGTRAIMYNSEVYKESPIKNWWDLTKPEWKGKVQIKDIFESGENLNMFITFIQHSAEVAAAYKDAFGKDLVLDKDCPNAGYQFMKDFLENDPVFVGSDGDIAKNVGTKGQKDPPIGEADGAKFRDVVAGKLAFNLVTDAKPTAVVFYQTYLAIIDQAPHPNAAKLMIRWMMGDQKGGQGYAPFYVPGDYPSRTDMTPPPGAPPYADLKAKSWFIDGVYCYENGPKALDFWVANQRKK
jgi:iron(III) transport system substrate-binding protein